MRVHRETRHFKTVVGSKSTRSSLKLCRFLRLRSIRSLLGPAFVVALSRCQDVCRIIVRFDINVIKIGSLDHKWIKMGQNGPNGH